MSKPGKWLYVVAGVVAVGGSAASLVHGCSSSTDSIHDMRRAEMPAQVELDLNPGRHGVFVEQRTFVAGEARTAAQPKELECTLAGVEGEPIELVRANRIETYDLGGYAGELRWEIHLLRGGRHALACTSDQAGPFYIAVGDGFSVSDVLVGIVGGAASVMIGLGIFFLTFIRRRSSKNQARAPGEPPPSGT